MGQRKVSIIDYNLGNLYSVKNACNTVGIDSIITSDPACIEESEGLILPGVGSFKAAMDNIHALNLFEVIRRKVYSGTPILGVCLGLQLLFEESEEYGKHKGLEIIKGSVKKFNFEGNQKTKVPHVGWNKINSNGKSWNGTPFEGLKDDSYMYFVHSYFVEPTNEHDIFSVTNYEGSTFCSAIHQNNIYAMQFHPEKSGEPGLKIYRNWALTQNLI